MNVIDPEVRISRRIRGSQIDVFAAWTNQALFRTWFAPQIYHVAECEIDVRVGGRHVTTVVGPEGDRHTTAGIYTELDPPRSLAMTWNYSGDHPDAQAEESLLRVDFVAIDDTTTEIHLTHEQMLTDRAQQNVRSGWQECLDKLEAMFTT